jgi:D-alanyl-D-alanine dipeptidase
LVLAPAGAGHSIEGCAGRTDPYAGKPPKPPALIQKGDPKAHLTALRDQIPTLVEALKYASADNITGAPLYPAGTTCWLRPELAKRLSAAARLLAKGGFGLIVFDCYRPWSVQVRLWSVCPKPGLVADPSDASHHNRGAAVDLSLIRLSDQEPLEMPSAFDDLSHRARHNFQGGSRQAREHRRWLRVIMRRVGLRAIASEWWHYQLPQARRFAPLDLALPRASSSSR